MGQELAEAGQSELAGGGQAAERRVLLSHATELLLQARLQLPCDPEPRPWPGARMWGTGCPWGVAGGGVARYRMKDRLGR